MLPSLRPQQIARDFPLRRCARFPRSGGRSVVANPPHVAAFSELAHAGIALPCRGANCRRTVVPVADHRDTPRAERAVTRAPSTPRRADRDRDGQTRAGGSRARARSARVHGAPNHETTCTARPDRAPPPARSAGGRRRSPRWRRQASGTARHATARLGRACGSSRVIPAPRPGGRCRRRRPPARRDAPE